MSFPTAQTSHGLLACVTLRGQRSGSPNVIEECVRQMKKIVHQGVKFLSAFKSEPSWQGSSIPSSRQQSETRAQGWSCLYRGSALWGDLYPKCTVLHKDPRRLFATTLCSVYLMAERHWEFCQPWLRASKYSLGGQAPFP